MEHNTKTLLPALEILESQTVQDMQLAYSVINQLRDKLTLDEFLNRVRLSQLNGYKLFYALIDEKVVGAIGLRILDDLCWGHHLYVDDLVVDQSFRSQGIGKKLMKYGQFNFEVQHLLNTDAERGICKSSFDDAKPFREIRYRGRLGQQSLHCTRAVLIRVLHFIFESAYIEDLAHSEQCQYIRLASGISRTEAHKFYKGLGCRKTSFSFALKL